MKNPIMKITFLGGISCLFSCSIQAEDSCAVNSSEEQKPFSILVLFKDSELLQALAPGLFQKQDPFKPLEIKKYFDFPAICDPRDKKFQVSPPRPSWRPVGNTFGRPPKVISPSCGRNSKQKSFRRR